MRTASTRFGRRRNGGVTLVEVLVTLSITAALLTAVGMALNASVKGYEINQSETTLANRARLTLHRMLTNLRAGDSHQPYTASAQTTFANGLIVNDTGVAFYSDDGHATAYRYDAANKRIMADVDGVSRMMLDGVDAFSLKLEPMKSAAHIKAGLNYDELKRVTILLTIHDADAVTALADKSGRTMTVSSSAVPRRNAW